MGALADASAYPLSDQFASELERHRRELTGYCYRMMGAGSEAEDAVQETFLRAWRARGGFERRATLRSWLYKIATNVCIDMPQRPQRRARPMDLASASSTATATLNQLADDAWVQPIADSRVIDDDLDPAELAVQRDTLRLAFIAALAHLPRRQRAVLILREVLHWQASEVADLLETTTASVNSALQRARRTLDELELEGDEPGLDDDDQELLDRYVGYFERYDIDSLVSLLREDATSRCRRTRSGSAGPRRSTAGCSARAPRVATVESSPRTPTAVRHLRPTVSTPKAASMRGRSR